MSPCLGIVKQSAAMGQRYVVREAKTKQELDDIMTVIWAANHTPYEPFLQLYFPVLGYTAAHREAAIAESRERLWRQHQEDTSSHWFYAFDTVTNRAVGCAQWVVSTSNPFASGTPKLAAPWWPEGECRRFCESILNQIYRPRTSWMMRPHCALNWMAVDPSHRLRGIGCLLMDVGVARADELNLECWLEASEMGKPLYEKFGYQSLLKIALDGEKPKASDEWRRCAHEMTPRPIFAMWRPRKSLHTGGQGELRMPWALGTER